MLSSLSHRSSVKNAVKSGPPPTNNTRYRLVCLDWPPGTYWDPWSARIFSSTDTSVEVFPDFAFNSAWDFAETITAHNYTGNRHYAVGVLDGSLFIDMTFSVPTSIKRMEWTTVFAIPDYASRWPAIVGLQTLVNGTWTQIASIPDPTPTSYLKQLQGF